MEPTYPPGPQTQPPLHSGEYDFITNPAKPPKKSLFSMGGGSKSGLLITIVGGLVILTLILVMASLLFGGESNKEVLLSVAKKQSEVIAVAEVGAEDSGSNQSKSLALSVQLTVASDRSDLIAQISKNDKVKEKDYAAIPSADVTSQLETAQRNGRFDEVFSNVIKQELTEYQQELRTANNTVKNKATKDLLSKDFENVSLLLTVSGS